MEDIQNKAVETYQRNINYLQEKHPNIIRLFSVLEQAIQNGDYKEKYALEYVNNGFDIQELATGSYLYEKDSASVSKELLKQVNFDKDSNTIEGMPIFYKDENEELSDKNRGLLGLYPIMRYTIDNSFKEGLHRFKEIKKYIFLGVALGLHIPLIHKKIKAKNYLIVEDNIEFFKLSLFTTDYAEIAKESKLYFSIGANKDEFIDVFSSYFYDSSFDNKFLKYTHLGTHSNEKIKYMQLVISTSPYHVFAYRTQLEKLLRPLQYIHDGSYILNLAKKFQKTIFEEKPLLLLAAGPSLAKNIEWVKKNQNNFIIVAVSATLRMLYENNIVPNIITHVDGYDASLVHFKDIDTKEFFKDSIAIVEAFTPLAVRSMFKKEQIFTVTNNVEYFQGFEGVPASCVGSFTFNLLLQTNVQELYLLGLDLALDQKSGETHSKGHSYSNKLDVKNSQVSELISVKKNIQVVAGNFVSEVHTISEFNISIEYINKFITTHKGITQNIYNLSDGAKFQHTVPLKVEDVKVQIISKKDVYSQLKDSLRIYSLNRLRDSDILSMREKLQDAQEIKKSIDLYASKNYSSSDLFIYELTSLYMQLLQKKNPEQNNLVHIYMKYFNYLFPILIDFFNTQGLKHKKRDVKKLNKLIIEELYEIESIYSSTLNNFLETKIEGNIDDK